MDINIILGVFLIIIVIYFLLLGTSVWRRNREAEQAPQWNQFRERLFLQAQEDQVKAHRISVTLQNRYKGLGAPYAEDRDQAIAILRRIYKNAKTILKDRDNRRPIPEHPTPNSWKALLIGPLWTETKKRQGWWKATQGLGFRQSKNPSGFSAVEKLEGRLAAKGKQTKEGFETLKNEADQLTEAFQAEARTATHFQDQIQTLTEIVNQIDKTIATYLDETELSPKQVATAAANWVDYEKGLAQLSQTLKESKDIRRDTRSQLEKNQSVIDTIETLLRGEEEAGHPTPSFRETLNAEIRSKEDLEQKRETGVYLQEPAQAQYGQLQALEKNLRLLIQERSKLDERLIRGEREISMTEAWIRAVEPAFIIDQTGIVLEEVQKQQAALYHLIQSSEDMDLLSSQVFIDPQKLASNRTIFDQQVKKYQSLHQELQQQIPAAIPQVRTAIQNLWPLNTHYHQGLDLDALSSQIQSLEKIWSVLKEPPQIKESQIDGVIAELEEVEKSLQEIKNASQKTEEQLQANSADLRDVQRILDDPTFTEYQQVMQVIWREDQVSLADPAGDYALKAEGLHASVERIDTDFATATRQAARLLTNMRTLWDSYKEQYAGEMKNYQALAVKLETLQSRLERYQGHELSTFRTQAADPLQRIRDWLQVFPTQSIQALMFHIDDGIELFDSETAAYKELSAEDQLYSLAKDEALSGIAEAQTAIDEAEKALIKTPWGPKNSDRKVKTQGERNPALEHSYRYLDAAEAAYREITDPEIEYQNSVEKAVSDLREGVVQYADHAKGEADHIYQEIREQSKDIEQKCKDLEKTLADGEGHAMRLEDTGFRSQWAEIYRKYRAFEKVVEEQDSYRAAFSYLEQALIEARYQIERMWAFERGE